MKSNLVKLSKNQVKAIVDLDQKDLQKYLGKAEDVLSREVEIKGFRRGKAPKDLIKKHIGQGGIRSLALEIAVEQSLSEVIESNSLDILNTPRLSIEKNDSVRLQYSAILDLFPEVSLVDLAEIKIKRKEVSIGEQEIDDTLEVIRNSRARFMDKTQDEAAENGDRVEVDFEVKREGRVIEGGVSKNHPLVIGGLSFIPGFEDRLVGMKKGENRSFSLVAPADYFHKDVAGKKLDFEVKVNDIKKVITPEINDDFARTVGRFADLGELKKSVKEGLTREKKLKENQKLRLEILDSIIQRSKIEVPDNLLNNQLDLMVSDFDQTLHEKGMELGLYLAKMGKTQEELKSDWKKDAEKQVKISLVLRQVAKDFNIEASREEVEEATGQLIQAAMLKEGAEQADIDSTKIKEKVAAGIVNEKTLEYIESRCAV